MDASPYMKPGTLVVLEGLDKTGKTTQAELLKLALDPAATEHVHMPRGFTRFTQQVYRILESDDCRPSPGIGRQLAHLACHAESVPRIKELLRERAVLLDRWWWSTVAYGWHSGEVPRDGLSEDVFRGLIDSIWGEVHASVIFIFGEPHEEDANNLAAVKEGYRILAYQHEHATVDVPLAEPEQVTRFILDELAQRDLLSESP